MDKNEGNPPLTPSNIEPPNPASCYPLREYDVALSDLIGWTETRALARLGKPDSKSPGRTWSQDEGGKHKTFVRDNSGAVVEMHVFGITPRKIPVGMLYETWGYHNVRGATWVLFFVKEPSSPAQVVEVAQIPMGAVF